MTQIREPPEFPGRFKCAVVRAAGAGGGAEVVVCVATACDVAARLAPGNTTQAVAVGSDAVPLVLGEQDPGKPASAQVSSERQRSLTDHAVQRHAQPERADVVASGLDVVAPLLFVPGALPAGEVGALLGALAGPLDPVDLLSVESAHDGAEPGVLPIEGDTYGLRRWR